MSFINKTEQKESTFIRKY